MAAFPGLDVAAHPSLHALPGATSPAPTHQLHQHVQPAGSGASPGALGYPAPTHHLPAYPPASALAGLQPPTGGNAACSMSPLPTECATSPPASAALLSAVPPPEAPEALEAPEAPEGHVPAAAPLPVRPVPAASWPSPGAASAAVEGPASGKKTVGGGVLGSAVLAVLAQEGPSPHGRTSPSRDGAPEDVPRAARDTFSPLLGRAMEEPAVPLPDARDAVATVPVVPTVSASLCDVVAVPASLDESAGPGGGAGPAATAPAGGGAGPAPRVFAAVVVVVPGSAGEEANAVERLVGGAHGEKAAN
ncbi:hypothetical protein T484DRAFT_1964784 [Baffinella frigidus]|nr:hypothetical protein T484DRAFT_1964784 [Cryptophyta sp. CCMP2293]